MPGRERRLLILGGTAEAAALAQAAVARFGDRLEVTTSLAGRTPEPKAVAGSLRVGGFGGEAGLAAFLREAQIDLLVDATHPFAATIARHARLAAEATGTARLVLLRPPWRPEPGDRWIEAADMAAAAAMLPRLGHSAFLAIGTRALGAFASVRGVRFVVRLIAAPRAALPIAVSRLIIGRPPFTLDAERLLLQRYAVEAMVTKASGGIAAAKLAAAREAGLPVIMVARPPAEPGATVATPAEALAWIAARLDRGAGTGEVSA
ncbi:MAG TPA: cobalt-precorrin-6A reductase [Stellaceae bacterium]|nr:cobalt-precorrin-6A reductase [Stellaceae bacterium]